MNNERVRKVQVEIINKGDLPVWPQSIRFFYVLFFLLLAILMPLLLTRIIARLGDGESIPFFVDIGLAIYVSMLMILVDMSGFHNFGVSRRVRIGNGAVHGVGITVPSNRKILVAVFVMVVTAIYGLGAACTFHFGSGESWLPFSRDNAAGANCMAMCGGGAVIVLIFLTLTWEITTYTLYIDGIDRTVRSPWFSVARGRDAFVRWDDILEVISDEDIYNSNINYPKIRIVTDGDVHYSRKLKLESEVELTIRAGNLVAEPNALINLIRFLKDNPEHRSILADPDARELLRPLPLFERFRQAKEVKRLESEAKKAKKVSRKNSG